SGSTSSQTPRTTVASNAIEAATKAVKWKVVHLGSGTRNPPMKRLVVRLISSVSRTVSAAAHSPRRSHQTEARRSHSARPRETGRAVPAEPGPPRLEVAGVAGAPSIPGQSGAVGRRGGSLPAGGPRPAAPPARDDSACGRPGWGSALRAPGGLGAWR